MSEQRESSPTKGSAMKTTAPQLAINAVRLVRTLTLVVSLFQLTSDGTKLALIPDICNFAYRTETADTFESPLPEKTAQVKQQSGAGYPRQPRLSVTPLKAFILGSCCCLSFSIRSIISPALLFSGSKSRKKRPALTTGRFIAIFNFASSVFTFYTSSTPAE